MGIPDKNLRRVLRHVAGAALTMACVAGFASPKPGPAGEKAAGEAEIAALLAWHLDATGVYGAVHPDGWTQLSRRAEPAARAKSAADQPR